MQEGSGSLNELYELLLLWRGHHWPSSLRYAFNLMTILNSAIKFSLHMCICILIKLYDCYIFIQCSCLENLFMEERRDEIQWHCTFWPNNEHLLAIMLIPFHINLMQVDNVFYMLLSLHLFFFLKNTFTRLEVIFSYHNISCQDRTKNP